MSGHIFTIGQVMSGTAEGRQAKAPGREPQGEGIMKGPSGRKATVLFVDDEEIIRRSAIRLLRNEGLEFMEAGNGVAALELFEKERADLVITDLRMPLMGGLELLRRVKETDSGAKVIVTSGNFSRAEREEAYAQGAMAALDKPFRIETLKAAIASALSGKPAGAVRQARILVVDDDDCSRDALSFILGEEGHKITSAENGIDGLAAFYGGRVDLVVSDLHMPKMNGHEMMLEIRKANPAAKVIIVSGEASAAEREGLLRDGAYAVLMKPVEASDLLAVINQAVSE